MEDNAENYLIFLWSYVERILLLYLFEEEDEGEQNEGTWCDLVRDTLKYHPHTASHWFWDLLKWITHYLCGSNYVRYGKKPKGSNLAQVISMLRAYGWSYRTQYLYGPETNPDFHISQRWWVQFLKDTIKGKDTDTVFILETIEAYYGMGYCFDEADYFFKDELEIRYIHLSRQVGELPKKTKEDLATFSSKLFMLHNYGTAPSVKIENGFLMVCFVVPFLYSDECYTDIVWGDDGFEPSIVLLLEIIDRIIHRHK